jgi:hypothetical protein
MLSLKVKENFTMNKLIAVALCVLAFAAPSFAQTVSTSNLQAPLPVAQSPVTSFFDSTLIATQTFAVAASSTAAVLIGTLPAGSKGVYVCTDVALNFGNASCTTGTNWPTIAAGGSQLFVVSPLDVTPTVYVSQRATGATATVRLVPFK